MSAPAGILRATPETLPPRRSRVWGKLRRNPAAILGAVLVTLFIGAALAAPFLPIPGPTETDWSAVRKPPSADHPFGTDEIGRDVLSRMLWGAQASLLAGVVSVAIAVLLGVLAGYARGWTDAAISRMTEALLAAPFLILAIALAAFLGPSLRNAMIAIGLSAAPLFIRLARGQTMAVMTEDYVESAHAIGIGHGALIMRYILPNIFPPILVQATLTIATAIIAEASLSFLGLGQQPPAPSWGSMLNVAKNSWCRRPGWLSGRGSRSFWWCSGSTCWVTACATRSTPATREQPMRFTTRPEILGTFGVVTSTHWIASAVGMGLLEKGGNAFDAAVAMGFVLHVVEPHLNGPLGDMPALIRPAADAVPTVVCGQGTAPAGATVAHYRAEGLDLIPGSGLLATVIPGAFDAWMLIARDHGTLPLRTLLEPAIHYAQAGHPLLPRAAATIAGLAGFFAKEWPTSSATWTPGGRAPVPGALFANPDLAATWRRLLDEAEGRRGREAQIDAAREVFYRGFIAEAIDDWMREARVRDAAGGRRKGVLSGQDMAGWQASYEAPLAVDYHGWTVWKPGVWSQGPTFLQALRLLEGTGIENEGPDGAGFVHTVTEAMKLAFADREAYYGDPLHAEIPVDTLLSRAYAASRRGLIEPQASRDQRPGRIPGFEPWAKAAIARAARRTPEAAAGAGEPTMAHLSERRGDTVHLDVIDRWGNMVSATPSGGWLQSSRVVPGLGMPGRRSARSICSTLRDAARHIPASSASTGPADRPAPTLHRRECNIRSGIVTLTKAAARLPASMVMQPQPRASRRMPEIEVRGRYGGRSGGAEG